MPKGHPVVSADVKKQILQRVKQGSSSIPEIAKDHGLVPKVIYNWIARGVTAPPSLIELARLKRENQTLLEIIGKITVDLANEKKKMGYR